MNNYIGRKAAYALAASCLSLSWATICAAQSSATPNATPGAASEADPGEIIVTAQKRSESVNRVPISISVLTGQQLAASGVTSTQRLEVATPGLVFGNTNGFAQPYIRGVGTDLILPGEESPVGFYLDGVYLPFTAALIQEFSDIERVEVLKGPQGTLYGRNTTGGAVNIITRSPSQELAANADVNIGTRGYRKLAGYVSGGLAEGLAASVSGIVAQHNGFYRILNSGTRSDDQDEWGVRGKLKWAPGDNVEIVVGGDYLRKHDTNDVVFTNMINSTGIVSSPTTGPSTTPRTTFSDASPPARRLQVAWGLNGTIKVDWDWARLTSITAYRHDFLASSADGDGTANPLLFFDVNDYSKSFTQELQLASSSGAEAPFSWLVGGFFLKGSASVSPLYVWSGIPNSDPANTIISGSSGIRNFAFYGQGTLRLIDHFSVIGGLRYSNERRTLKNDSLTLPSGTGGYTTYDLFDPMIRGAFGLAPLQDTATSSSVDPKITLQYENNRQLLYATFSKGYKAGAYNLGSTDVGPLRPERMESFEIGGKHRVTAGGIQFNWSLFRYKYRNLQVSVVDQSTGGQTATRNAASTRGKGIDVDIMVPVNRYARFSLGGAYLNVKYSNFPNASVVDLINGEINIASGGFVSRDASGLYGVRSPKLTLSAQGTFTLPLASGRIDANPTVNYNSGFYFDPGNLIRQNRYALVNLSVMYHSEGDQFAFGVFANNLTNKSIVQGISPTAYRVAGNYNDPRIIGITFSYKH